MATEQDKLKQTIWAVLLTAMGLLLCFKTPYALQRAPESSFLNFARYFIGAFLILGGMKKFFKLFFTKSEDASTEK